MALFSDREHIVWHCVRTTCQRFLHHYDQPISGIWISDLLSCTPSQPLCELWTFRSHALSLSGARRLYSSRRRKCVDVFSRGRNLAAAFVHWRELIKYWEWVRRKESNVTQRDFCNFIISWLVSISLRRHWRRIVSGTNCLESDRCVRKPSSLM